MPYKSLADFLEELAATDELVRVTAEVDSVLEIAEITRRVADAGGAALLFDRVRGQSIAVVTNLLGTEARACRALGVESLDALPERLEALIAEHTPQNWFDRLKMTGDAGGADRFRAKAAKTGACQQVVHLGRDVDLASLPLLKCWPDESGPTLTAGRLVTEDRQSQLRGVTPATLVALDANRLAVVDDGHSTFARHWTDHRTAGERMPAAVVLGGDPVATVAANLETGMEVDAYHLAGLLRGKPLELVKCRTHALEVPTDAEIVVEGYFDPELPEAEVTVAGQGGQYYRPACSAAVLQVTAVTHRNRPLLPAIVEGGQRGEVGVLAKARERMILPALRARAPDVVDVHLPPLGASHGFALVAIRKRFAGHARQIAAALWGTDELKFTKFLVLVDHDVDVHDPANVWQRVGANVAPECDLLFFDGPAHGSDHAGTLFPLARHVALDATAKLSSERRGTWPATLDAGEEIRSRVSARWSEYQLESILREYAGETR